MQSNPCSFPSIQYPKIDKPRCLVVRPEASRSAHGGDEIVYGRSLEFLSRAMHIETCELRANSRTRQFLELAKGIPPEVTRFLGPQNSSRVSQAIQVTRPDVVCFFNEVTFPFLTSAKLAGVRSVLVAHNVHSVVASSDPNWWPRLFQMTARQFERRWYDDRAAELVCISKLDVAGLRKAGLTRTNIFIAPPGCPPSSPLIDNAPLTPELVLTGSYAWWRKKRDLKAFSERDRLPIKIIAFDETARMILGSQAIRPSSEHNWERAIRFGLITDRFLGGFKLKALEYVARNCIVLSACDISSEFSGLPYSKTFVRQISSKQDLWQTIQRMTQSPDSAKQFQDFKAACLARFDWETCLLPLRDAAEATLARGK